MSGEGTGSRTRLAPSRLAVLTLDARAGWRSLRRTPGLLVVVVLSLALGIGATAAIYTIIEGMYLTRIAAPRPEELFTVERYNRPVAVRYGSFVDLRTARGVPRMAAFRLEPAEARVAGAERADNLWVDLASREYFEVLGVRPLLGRLLTDADEASAQQVAVVSETYWKSRIGGDGDVLGRTILLNERPFSIVGVLPSVFVGVFFARRSDVIVPITTSPAGYPNVRRLPVRLIGRLDRHRAQSEQSAALRRTLERCCLAPTTESDANEMSNAPAHFVRADDPPVGASAELLSGQRGSGLPVALADASHGLTWGKDFRARYQGVIAALFVGALLMLTMACANVATLLLARAESREHEFATRVALGASRRRIAVQLLMEASQLAVLGVTLGLAVAWCTVGLLRAGLPPSSFGLTTVVQLRPSWGVLALTAGLGAIAAFLVSLWPVRHVTGVDIMPGLTGTGLGLARRSRVSRWLVIAQVALSVVLVTSATLYLLTVHNLLRFDGGYRTRTILLAVTEIRDDLCTGSAHYRDLRRCFSAVERDAARLATYEEFRVAVERLPGVAGAALTFGTPVLRTGVIPGPVRVGDGANGRLFETLNDVVSPGFFGASGIGLVAGRDFQASDRAGSEPVVVVSQSFARTKFSGQQALGAPLGIQRGSVARIVGIARDASYDPGQSAFVELRNASNDVVYHPLLQVRRTPPTLTLIVRTMADPEALAPAVQSVARRLPGIALTRVTSLRSVLHEATARERAGSLLATVFGCAAVILSAIGVYAVVAHHVHRRTREIGLRIAVGARPSDALRLVIMDALAMTGAGVALGMGASLAITRLIRSQLYGVSTADPRALLAGALGLLLIGLAGSAIPGLRAARVDPLVALRHE